MGTLAGVACTATSACTAVGRRAESSPTLGEGTLAERWNGKSWRAQPSPNPAGAGGAVFSGVSCTGPTACMAIGSSSDQTGENEFTLAEAWNGTNWNLLNTPTPASGVAELQGVSCTATPSCMAVGNFVNNLSNEVTLAEAWNGTYWTVVKTPQP
jgi:hypothetical protein